MGYEAQEAGLPADPSPLQAASLVQTFSPSNPGTPSLPSLPGMPWGRGIV